VVDEVQKWIGAANLRVTGPQSGFGIVGGFVVGDIGEVGNGRQIQLTFAGRQREQHQRGYMREVSWL
jgi:hypothetical protein